VNEADNQRQPNANPDGTADYESESKIRHRAAFEIASAGNAMRTFLFPVASCDASSS